MNIFAEAELSGHLNALLENSARPFAVKTRISFSAFNEPDYVKYFVAQYRVEPIVFHEDQVYVTEREQMIPTERFSRAFDTRGGASYSKQVINLFIFHFQGSLAFFTFLPLAAWFGVWKWSWTTTRSRSISLNWRDDPEENQEKRRTLIYAISRSKQLTLYAKSMLTT